jgi:hypothetical protein
MDDEMLFKIVNWSNSKLQNILDHNILTGPFNTYKSNSNYNTNSTAINATGEIPSATKPVNETSARKLRKFLLLTLPEKWIPR